MSFTHAFTFFYTDTDKQVLCDSLQKHVDTEMQKGSLLSHQSTLGTLIESSRQ